MRLITYILLSILSVFCFVQAQGQGVSVFGTTNVNGFSKTVGTLWLSKYADTDSIDNYAAFDAEGKVYKKTAGSPIDTTLYLKKTDTSRSGIITTYYYVDSLLRSIPDTSYYTLQRVTNNDSVTTAKVTMGKIVLNSSIDVGTPDAAALISRTLSGSTAAGHGFRDQTTYSRGNSGGYNSFDGAPTVTGAKVDHAVSFQSRINVNAPATTDTMNDLYSMVGINILTRGYIRRNYNGGEAWDITKGVNGSIGVNYGFATRALTAGRKNFAFYSGGQTSSSFGGNVGVGLPADSLPTPNPIFRGGDSATLHINGLFPNIRFTHKDPVLNNTDFSFGTDHLNVLMYTDDSMYYRWYNKGVERMRLTATGKFLINTTNESQNANLITSGGVQFASLSQPTAGQSVLTTNSSGLLSLTNLSSTYATQATVATKVAYSDTTLIISTHAYVLANFWANGGNSFGAASSIGTNDNNAFRIRVNNSIYHYFFPSGNVGLMQTTDAGFALDVGGTGRFTGNLSAGSSGTTGTTLRGDAILFANQASAMIKRNHGTGMTGLHYGPVEGGGGGWRHYFYGANTGWTIRMMHGSMMIASLAQTTDIAQASNSILDLSSTTAVFYPPRMTSTQRNAITVVAGAEVYDATASKQSTYERHKWVYQKTINDTTFSGSTLTVNAWNNYYVFNGTTTTVTFPALTSTNKEIELLNIGTGNITLNSNTGSNDFYDMSTGTATNTITIPPNTALGFLLNGTYFITK